MTISLSRKTARYSVKNVPSPSVTLVFLFGKYCAGKASRRPADGLASEFHSARLPAALNIRLRFAKCFGRVSFGLHLARPMSKAPFRSTVSFCNRRRRVEGWGWEGLEEEMAAGGRGRKDPFGISDILPECKLSDLAARCRFSHKCLSPPFLPVYLLPRPSRRTRSFPVFRKISSRVNIAVKCMCMRNYAVITLRGISLTCGNATRGFSTYLSSRIKCPRLITLQFNA